jgi:D-alanyl-D-alanine carboxypeptidase
MSAALVLVGCTTGPAAEPPDPTASVPSSTGACVADPAAVSRAALPESAMQTLEGDTAVALHEAVETALEQTSASGAVVGIRSPEGTWVEAFGDADAATSTAMTTDIYQRIGSITKTFTGTLVLQLAQEGLLSLDDPISMYLDGIPNGDTVTLRLMISMTSGLASYTLDPGWQESYFANPTEVWTPDELLAIIKTLTPSFEPGAAYEYSNTNFVLLGLVAEKVTGQPIADLLQQRIIEPLELTHTVFPGESADFPSPHAQGATLQATNATPEAPANPTDWNPAWGFTAGEMISSIDDLLTYGRALGTGQGLLDPSEQEQRLSSFSADRETYSYGYALGCVGGWVGHTGELPGFNSAIYYQTDSDTIVAVMTNSDISSGDCTRSPLLATNQTGIFCSAPAPRIFAAIGDALGTPFAPPPQD